MPLFTIAVPCAGFAAIAFADLSTRAVCCQTTVGHCANPVEAELTRGALFVVGTETAQVVLAEQAAAAICGREAIPYSAGPADTELPCRALAFLGASCAAVVGADLSSFAIGEVATVSLLAASVETKIAGTTLTVSKAGSTLIGFA